MSMFSKFIEAIAPLLSFLFFLGFIVLVLKSLIGAYK
jgi:hypothetical protein